MDQLQRQKYTLENEIRMLEKQRRDTESFLERLEATRTQEYTQYTSEIKRLTKQRNELMEQVEKLQETTGAITGAYETAKKELQAYKEKELADTDEHLRMAKQMAATIEETALANKQEAAQILLDAKSKERELMDKEDVVINAHQKNVKTEVELIAKQQLMETAMQTHRLLMETKQKEAAEITESIRILHDQKITLDNKIKAEEARMDAARITLADRVEACDMREKAQNNIAALQAKTAREQQEEAILLKDRADALERAVVEMRGKGAQI